MHSEWKGLHTCQHTGPVYSSIEAAEGSYPVVLIGSDGNEPCLKEGERAKVLVGI